MASEAATSDWRAIENASEISKTKPTKDSHHAINDCSNIAVCIHPVLYLGIWSLQVKVKINSKSTQWMIVVRDFLLCDRVKDWSLYWRNLSVQVQCYFEFWSSWVGVNIVMRNWIRFLMNRASCITSTSRNFYMAPASWGFVTFVEAANTPNLINQNALERYEAEDIYCLDNKSSISNPFVRTITCVAFSYSNAPSWWSSRKSN